MRRVPPRFLGPASIRSDEQRIDIRLQAAAVLRQQNEQRYATRGAVRKAKAKSKHMPEHPTPAGDQPTGEPETAQMKERSHRPSELPPPALHGKRPQEPENVCGMGESAETTEEGPPPAKIQRLESSVGPNF